MSAQNYITGYTSLLKEIESNKTKQIFVYFGGDLDENGKSWCPDCVAAQPVVESNLKSLHDGAIFIHCGVGDKTFWKDPGNIFRTNEQLKLRCVPTLLQWGQSQRLEEGQLTDASAVQSMFSGK